ncbi:MAG: hypothetical protein ACOZAK_00505 [Patescibacteria group bacterium]
MTKVFSFLKSLIKQKYFLIFCLFFVISFIFFQSTFWYQDQSFFIKSKLWSDFAAHLPLIRSFSLGDNFSPIEYPFFAGEKISYHFLFYLGVGLLEKVGFRIDLALNILSALGMSLLLTMIIRLGAYFFNFKAGLVAVVLFLFNGSLSWLKFYENIAPTDLIEFINSLTTQKHYASFGPWDGGIISAFWNWNIFTNQRHLALGLGILLWLVYLFEKKFSTKEIFFSKKELFFTGLLIIILPLFHQASYAFLGIYLLVKLLSNKNKLTRLIIIFFGLVGGFSLLIYQFFGSSFTPIYEFGFLAKSNNLLDLVNYCFYNFGFYIFFIPLLLLFVFWKKDFKKIRTIYLSGLIVFILSFLFRFSPDIINNHKFINIFLLILNISVAGLLVSAFQKQSFIKKIGVSLVFIGLTFSGLVDLFPVLNDTLVVKKDYQQTEFGNWIVNNTAKNSVFLVNSYLYNPASLAGRKLYLDYGYFAWSMGYADRERRNIQQQIFSAAITMPEWCELMKTEKIDYLALDMGEKQFLLEYKFDQAAFIEFLAPQVFDEVWGVSNTQLYNVKELCQ